MLIVEWNERVLLQLLICTTRDPNLVRLARFIDNRYHMVHDGVLVEMSNSLDGFTVGLYYNVFRRVFPIAGLPLNIYIGK